MAELALVKDCSEANLGRLKDFQAQLSAFGGIEAAREGFGVARAEPCDGRASGCRDLPGGACNCNCIQDLSKPEERAGNQHDGF